jgi:hypothetical protein
LLKILDVQDRMLAIARCREKTLKTPETSHRLSCEPFGDGAEGNGLEGRLHLPGFACFIERGLVFESRSMAGRPAGVYRKAPSSATEAVSSS